MPFASVNGIEIYHEYHGTEGPPLLVITGTGNDLRVSRPKHSPFNKSFTVLHYDQRGLGQTSVPDGPYEMADYAADAAAMIRFAGWEKCHVVGTSFGGMVAQHLAISYPELVDRLALVCTSPGGSKPSFPLHTIEVLDVESKLEMMLGLLDSRWNPAADEPIPDWPPGWYDGYIARERVEPDAEATVGRGRQLDARSRHDVERRLRDIESATLVCSGEWDDLAPVVNGMALADSIPNAQMRAFNAGHLITIQDPSAVPTIVDFFNGELGPE